MASETTSGSTNGFFLFIGTTTADAAISKLKATRVFYRQKRLESGPENWRTIVDLIESPELIGVIAKLTADNYGRLLQAPWSEVGRELLSALSEVRHIVFVHETVVSGKGEPPPSPALDVVDEDAEEYYHYLANHYFSPPPDEVRRRVNELLSRCGIDVVPYQTNAQLSVLSASFIEDNEKNLWFRLYVPNGRIYAAEADKLLRMFREWLTRVKRQRIRQDGYETGSGHVYEFFGDEAASPTDLTTRFDDFSRFLELCGDSPDDAREELTAAGLDRRTAEDLVKRYGKEVRRLHLDLRHARETALLSIRHRLESELIDIFDGDSPEWGEIVSIVEAAVPSSESTTVALEAGRMTDLTAPANVTINQNVFHHVQGTIIQGLQGTAHLGPEPKELLELVGRYGGADAGPLASAVHELEDGDARHADRLEAKQRLKGFLFRLAGRVEDSVLTALQRYVEGKVGL
jgi:hypothetical protein